MSIELYKNLEKRALEIGVRKERFDEFSKYMLEAAIKRVNEIPNHYNTLRKKAIETGIEYGMDNKSAEAMAKSFVSIDKIKYTLDSSMVSEFSTGDFFWLGDQMRLYAEVYANSRDEFAANKAYHLSSFLNIPVYDQKDEKVQEEISSNQKPLD